MSRQPPTWPIILGAIMIWAATSLLSAYPPVAPTKVDLGPPSATPVSDPKPEPPAGLTIDGFISAAHDGDTLTFVQTVEYQVRIRDCWTPELWEKGGPDAAKALQKFAVGRRGRLHIPFKKSGKFGDEMSFNRVVGDVWPEGCQVDVGTEMVRSGWATRERPKEAKEE